MTRSFSTIQKCALASRCSFSPCIRWTMCRALWTQRQDVGWLDDDLVDIGHLGLGNWLSSAELSVQNRTVLLWFL